MNRTAVGVAILIAAICLLGAYAWSSRSGSLAPSPAASSARNGTGTRQPVPLAGSTVSAPDSSRQRLADASSASSGADDSAADAPPPPPRPHPLLRDSDDAASDGWQEVQSTADDRVAEAMQRAARAAAHAEEPGPLTVDYPLDESIFPPEIVSPTFLWHDPDERADSWLVDVSVDDSEHLYVLSAGRPPAAGPIDPACIAESNEIYKPTPYQASARSWTPDAEVWAAIQQRAVEQPASVVICGFHSDDPDTIRSRGQISIRVSRDPVGAPIFYRDVPLAPALTEKGVVKPLGDEAVSLIGWRLRDISLPESRLLLTDVPTCTNCHSFSDDGRTLGMDLDGPQGDKGAYVLSNLTQQTKIENRDVISWNSFTDKPPGHKTIGFLSRVSPDGQHVVTTLNEEVYVSNFMDYRFLQVFFPTRGILAYYSRADEQIRALPGADDPQYVHCDAVWTPDGEHLVFARAAAKDPYPTHGRLPSKANEPLETQIQYDLYRMPFGGGQGGSPEPIEGASQNGMSNTFPKVSPDGKWIVFVKCRNGQLLRPDSTLWIVPAEGGEARQMRCNTSRMNSWHSFSPNSRWMVFSSKANTPYTQLFLTHLDEQGNDSPAILLPNSTAANRAANLPEFVNLAYDQLLSIEVPAVEYVRRALSGVELAKQSRFDEAIAEFDAAVALQPDFQHAHVEAAIALTKQGKLDVALARINKALKLDENDSRAHGNAGIVLARCGRLDEAAARFQTALQIDPYYRTAHANLGRVFAEQGELDKALTHLRAAMELDPKDPLSRFELGDVLFRQGELPEAVEQFRATLALDPEAMQAHLLLSKALTMQGDYRAAVAQLERAVAADRNNVRPIADLAWLLAICPQDDIRDGQRAVELARRASAASQHRNPTLLATLAAAYAETGDFAEAVATCTRALRLSDPQDASQQQWMRETLKCYQAGRPYRPPTQ